MAGEGVVVGIEPCLLHDNQRFYQWATSLSQKFTHMFIILFLDYAIILALGLPACDPCVPIKGSYISCFYGFYIKFEVKKDQLKCEQEYFKW